MSIRGSQTLPEVATSIEVYEGARHMSDIDDLNGLESRSVAIAREAYHRGAVLWMTGLSGAGKSTVIRHVERQLFAKGFQAYVLDGDHVRQGLNADLGFSPAGRAENMRRIGEVAALFADADLIVIAAFISPHRAERAQARLAAGNVFHEVYVRAALATCEARDPRGLCARARRDEIREFAGVSAPYEEPEAADLIVDTTYAPEEMCGEAAENRMAHWLALAARTEVPQFRVVSPYYSYRTEGLQSGTHATAAAHGHG